MACLDASQLFLPLFGEFPARLIADRTYGWKPIAPLVRPHGFDDHARVVAFLARLNDRIERTAPGAAQDIHRSRRIGASGDGPDDFVQIDDVDVVVHNDHGSPQVGAGGCRYTPRISGTPACSIPFQTMAARKHDRYMP